jgi:DNA helicase HerA-like ATPase
MLIPSTTGRGKNNLVKVMLWSIMSRKEFGVLALDPTTSTIVVLLLSLRNLCLPSLGLAVQSEPQSFRI